MTEKQRIVRPGMWASFIQIPTSLLSYKELSPMAKLLFGRLMLYAGASGCAEPSQATLARDMCCGERNIRKLLDELEQQGFIERHTPTSRVNGKYTRASYTMLLHPALVPSMSNKPGTSVPTPPAQSFQKPAERNARLKDLMKKENTKDKSNSLKKAGTIVPKVGIKTGEDGTEEPAMKGSGETTAMVQERIFNFGEDSEYKRQAQEILDNNWDLFVYQWEKKTGEKLHPREKRHALRALCELVFHGKDIPVATFAGALAVQVYEDKYPVFSLEDWIRGEHWLDVPEEHDITTWLEARGNGEDN